MRRMASSADERKRHSTILNSKLVGARDSNPGLHGSEPYVRTSCPFVSCPILLVPRMRDASVTRQVTKSELAGGFIGETIKP